ncbi:N-acetylated-alpha-linked acidic dipeptidase 2-like [Diadema antillarum]|uniref:N-acetylated-alpha-linked acidic dipeptidase 2-like n=1 Tax=Diadema antillarum TaxID=105358 RepID=UPI003A83A933
MTMDGGVAAYSRFAEEMDMDSLDLKVRDNYGYGRWAATKRWCDFHRKAVGLVALVVTVFVVGLVIGHFLHFSIVQHCDLKKPNNATANESLSEPTEAPTPTNQYSAMLDSIISVNSLDAYLKLFTQKPHYAGSPNSENIVNRIKNIWLGWDGFKVYTKQYSVQLSRPNMTNPSRLDVVVSPPGTFGSSTYYPTDTLVNGTLPGFNPYSPNAEITADLVYINYGRAEDFHKLKNVGNIPIDGHICLVRMGKLSIRNIIQGCREHGGVGLVVFPGALHYLPNATKDSGPASSWWLPLNATIRESVRTAFGDPLTPLLPSLDYGKLNDSFLSVSENVTRPPPESIPADVDITHDFPVQTIGYEQARRYLQTLSLPRAPPDWQGLEDNAFEVGPGFANHARQFKMTINNVRKVTPITNVFGMIPGKEEPDRYIIVGNHRDSLTYGGVEPGTGTACFMELSRVLGSLYHQGWRPRRTVILASWDAGDDGNIGSAEWVEDNAEALRERAVAYINLNGAVQGNYTFAAAGSPLLTQIIYNATQRVKCPDRAHRKMSVYQNWAAKRSSSVGARIDPLGMGNDAAPFLHVAGVPSLDLKYTYDKEFYNDLPTYPVRHTIFDTYDYVRRFIDPDMSIHAAVTKVVAEAVLLLADDKLLKTEFVNYADALTEYFRDVLQQDEASLAPKSTMGHLRDALQRFNAAAQRFHQDNYIPPDMENPNLLREINDRAMSIDRAFTGDAGKFYLPQLRHVVFGPSRSGYEGEGFAPLRRAMENARLSGDLTQLEDALSTTIARIEAATRLLTDNILANNDAHS